jgi:hypothetical protein
MRGTEFLKLLYPLMCVLNEHVLCIVITILVVGLLKAITRGFGRVLMTIIEVAAEVLKSFREEFLPEIRRIKRILQDINRI